MFNCGRIITNASASPVVKKIHVMYTSAQALDMNIRQIVYIERFSYDLEMKAREQNRNDKRTEIERFDWFIERTDKRVWLFIG